MNQLFILLFLMISFLAKTQEENTFVEPKVSLGLYIPMVGYAAQHHHNTFNNEIKPLHFETKFQMVDYQILKARLILKDQFLIGGELLYNSQPNKKAGLTLIKYDHPQQHITDWSQKKFTAFTPRLFIGYRYTMDNIPNKKLFLGLNCYLNFDHLKYGSYSYTAKNVSNNDFYFYELNTTSNKKQSFTVELELAKQFTRNKDATTFLGGIRLGITPRNQTVVFNSITTNFEETPQSTSNSINFKTWTFHLGLVLSPEIHLK